MLITNTDEILSEDLPVIWLATKPLHKNINPNIKIPEESLL